jgi:hypothetical protein
MRDNGAPGEGGRAAAERRRTCAGPTPGRRTEFTAPALARSDDKGVVEDADNLLPLAILVFAALAVLVAVIVRLVRSGRVPLLGAGGDPPVAHPGART